MIARIASRSVPAATVTPVLAYPDVLEDADAHHECAVRAGARILNPPTDYPYGERRYTAEDLGGHHWTFSQSIADVDPAEWGGTLVDNGGEASGDEL